MESAFNIDMDAALQWPTSVDITVRVEYPNGPPEHSRLRLDGLPAASAVRVETCQSRDEAPDVALLRWTDLPGKSLFQRCLHVLAVHLFGTVNMPPRVTGLPLWSSLALEMNAGVDDPQAWEMELRSVGAGRAELRFRTRHDRPLETSVVALEALDADPLRALLRLGIARVKPTSRSRGTGGKVAAADGAKPLGRVVRAVDEAV